MDSMEDIDFEDIESRLYSQVFHASAESTEEADINNYIELSAEVFRRKYRYFEQKLNVPSSDPLLTFISLGGQELTEDTEDTNNKEQQTESFCSFVPESSNSTTSNSSLFNIPFTLDFSTVVANTENPEVLQNNITINDSSPPLVTNSDALVLTEPTHSHFTSIPVSKKTLKKKNKKGKKKVQISYFDQSYNNINRLVKKRAQGSLPNSDTICLSDSDSSDCVILEDMEGTKQRNVNTKFPRKYNEAEGGKPPEPDDDIIFVPPPPVEVINVDLDEGDSSVKKNNSKKITVNSKSSEPVENPESGFSNDFLDNPNLETNSDFNFALHGSDFNNSQTDVQPQKTSTEYCETESSCSTNELHSRNFSNTVKTIVFDEVEFPKDDIFSEKNLESFSSFITPKRSCNMKSKSSAGKTKTPLPNVEEEGDVSSDSSSSESDYESNSNSTNKKLEILPNLSPVVPDDDIPSKKLKKTAHEFFKGKKTLIDEKTNSSEPTKSTKKRKDSEKTKKRKSLGNDDEAIEENVDTVEDNHSVTPLKKKKKKKDNSLSVSQDNTDENKEKEREENSAKKKKKKRDSLTEIDSEILTQQKASNNVELDQQDNIEEGYTSERSKKKKKTRGNSENSEKDHPTDVTKIDNFIENLKTTMGLTTRLDKDRKKKKRKKDTRKEKLPELSKNVEEIIKDNAIGIEPQLGEIDKIKKKKKKDATTVDVEPIEKPTEEAESVQIDENSAENISETVVEDVTENPRDCIVIESSDGEAEVLSIDSDMDLEILDGVGDDMVLNCSTSKSSLDKVNVIDEDVSKIIDQTRAPAKDLDEFDLDTIQSKQSGNRGPRCNRCRHFGHPSIRCPEKPHPAPCTLCGRPDHQEPRCPNKRCTQCGNPGHYSTTYCSNCFKFRHLVCSLCQMPGHIQKFCPDLWRRYHFTSDGPIVAAVQPPILRKEQWCSGCARQGHLEHQCNYYKYHREFPPSTPFIINYNDVLNQNKHNPSPSFRPDAPPLVYPVASETMNPQIINPAVISPQLNNPSILPPQMVNNMLNFAPPSGLLPHSSTSNVTIQLANNPTPNDIVLQMSLNFNQANNASTGTHNNQINFQADRHPVKQYDVQLHNSRYIENFILSRQPQDVYDFIHEQVHSMENCDIDPRHLKRKLCKFDKMFNTNHQLPRILINEKNHWYRIMNMFIFGVHKQKDGKLHVNYLKRFLSQGSGNLRLDNHQRQSLFNSYWYIFGTHKRPFIDYYKIIRLLIRKYSNNKS